jgi:hypothetical protein
MPNTGKMNKDVDPASLKVGDYLDLKGMDFSEADLPALRTQKGNSFVLDFGGASLQNQQIRISLNTFTTAMTFRLLDGNRNVKNVFATLTGGNLADNKTALINWLQSLPYAVTLNNVGLSVDYLDVTINFAFSDYVVEASGCTYDILKEAISQTGVGKFMPIAYFNLDNSVIYWLTTQRNLPNKLSPITNVYSSVNSQIGITCLAHGLANNESVSIGGVNGVNANGIWTVTVIDADNFYLNTSFFTGAYTGGGIAYANIYGYGCIGVAQEDTLLDIFSFTPLLRSKKLNFCTKRQIYNPVVQRVGDLLQLYYTDNYNVPRVTYYRGDYVTDGAIQAINPLGQYSYLNLNIETSLQVNYNDYDLQFQEQAQSGGNVACGNWRYAVRFLTSTFAATEPSFMSNPIPVFVPNYVGFSDEAFQFENPIYGSTSNTISGKINRVRVSGINAGVFQFIELIAFQYAGEANTVTTSSYIIRRETLTPDQTEITLEHNGNEPGITFFDTQLANQVQAYIQTAGDMTAIQNRLVLADCAIQEQIDIREWVSTFKYSIKRKPLEIINGATTVGEFFDPNNVEAFVGYPFFEWDRFYVAPVLKSGQTLNAFFAFDLRWVTQADYLANTDYQFLSTNGTDRRDFTDDDLVTYDLGTYTPPVPGGPATSGVTTYDQIYLKLKNVDWDFLINGVQARDLFDGLRIVRAENVREVIGAGVAISSYQTGVGAKEFVEFTPFSPDYTSVSPRLPRMLAYYSPDDLFGDSTIEYGIDDKMILLGTYKSLFDISSTGSLIVPSAYRIYSPVIGGIQNAQISNVNSVTRINKGEAADIFDTFSGTTISYTKAAVPTSITTGTPGGGSNQSGPIVEIENAPNVTPTGFINSGYYYGLYFRQRTDKYGGIYANNVTVYTGAFLRVGDSEIDVYGGYVFNQKTWLKSYYAITSGSILTGQASGFNIISQNRTNTNLRVYNPDLTANLLYPVNVNDSTDWLTNNQDDLDQIAANSGYEINNTIQAVVVYNPFAQDNGKFIARKYYSELKPSGSLTDFFRIFLPLNFQDNPEAQGRIMRILNLNNNLFTLQQRGFTYEYFNSRGQLISTDSGQILIGDGSVLSRVGTNMSRYGLRERGAVIIGESQSGKDTALWFSSEYGEVLRFGDDGIRSVSQRDMMRTFFKKYNKWVTNANTPADGYGINGVWDDMGKNYFMTFKAWKPYLPWAADANYSIGDGATFGTIDQGVPQIWVALTNNINVPPSEGSRDWEKISVDNESYYNVFTFAYSEIKNGFTFFPYFLPNNYSTWGDSILSSNPLLDSTDRSKLYLYFENGNPNEFFDVQYPAGEIRLVMNWEPDLNKKLSAFMLNSNLKPERVTFTALFRNEESGEFFKETYLLASDFTTRENYQYSPIKNVLDDQGSPDGDTGRMEGMYCIVDIKFAEGDSVTLRDCIMRVKPSLRNFTS